jgi:hypothetical protein
LESTLRLKNDSLQAAGTAVNATRRRADDVALFGSFAVGAALTFCFTTDDPFITLRYAANLVHGHGPVFNVGERVEGFSSPLHLLLVAGAYVLPLGHDLLKVKLLSLAFAIATLFVARGLVDEFKLPPWGRTTCLILIGGSWSLAVVAGNGLETTIACWLTTLLVANLVRGNALGRPLLPALAAAALVALRPEGIAVTGFLAVMSLVAEPRTAAPLRRLAWFSGALAAELVLTLSRLVYYRSLFPNTYYAKEGALGQDVTRGVKYLSYLLPGVPAPLKLILLGFVVIGAVSIFRSSNRRLWYVIAALAAQIAFIVQSGGDWMIGDRFFAPVVPLSAILVTKGAAALIDFTAERFGSDLRIAQVGVCTTVVVVLTTTLVVPFQRFHDPVWASRGKFDDASLVVAGGYDTFSSHVWTEGPKFLRCVPSGSLVAYSEVGYAGFERLDLNFLDTRGLTDRKIARSAPSSAKSSVGVTDYSWLNPHSPVGSRILATRPVDVLSIDVPVIPPPPVALAGTYRLRYVDFYSTKFITRFFVPMLTVYQRVEPPAPHSVPNCDTKSLAKLETLGSWPPSAGHRNY